MVVDMSEWSSVKDRLPEINKDVLMYFAVEKNMAVGFLQEIDEHVTFWGAYPDGGWWTSCDCEPTHWMPLPEPPKEDNHD